MKIELNFAIRNEWQGCSLALEQENQNQPAANNASFDPR